VALSAEAGAKFGRPIDPYVRLRAFRDFNFSQWQIRASETPLWKALGWLLGRIRGQLHSAAR